MLDGGGDAARDVSLLNGGAAIMVGGGAKSLAEGIEKAREAIESGSAADVLSRLTELTNELAEESL